MRSSRYFLKTAIEEIDFDFESFSPCNAAARLDADLLPTNEAPKRPITLPITISINRTPAKKEKVKTFEVYSAITKADGVKNIAANP